MDKILATPRSFGKASPAPIELLEQAGYEVIPNPLGKIMTEDEMCEQIRDVSGIIIGVDPLSAKVLESAKNLKAISKYGVGTDNIDLEAAKGLGIPVSITRGANSNAVADYAFALMMACSRRVVEIHGRCLNKDWGKLTTIDVSGKTLGILGLGAIGRGVAKRSTGFDMKVMAYDPYWDDDYAKTNSIVKADPETIYRECDFISLHLPLTGETRGMIGEAQFAMMKPTAVLVNTARGGIIDEDALIAALKTNRIYAAGIDAFEQEPPERQGLYQIPNLIMGSHCGASTSGAVEAMGMMAAKNLLNDLQK